MASQPELEHEQLFDAVIELIKKYLVTYYDSSSKIVDFKSHHEISQLIDITLQDIGVDDNKLLALCDKVLSLSVHTVHPRFYNQLFSGIDEVGMLGSFLSTTANTSVYTFEMAPVFSIMEIEIFNQIKKLVEWDEIDGLFSPGGSISNMYGLMMARYHKFPESKETGIQSLPMIAVFCSEQSHYSVVKSAIIMGIGMNNVVKVKCDKRGKMIPSELDRELTDAQSKGVIPIAVVATCGTTVLGAIDPIDLIAPICKKHCVWLHVDAAVGGALLLSQKHRYKMAGIENADSLIWNPHKMIQIPLQCSLFVTKHKHVLFDCNATKATYLFQEDKVSYDHTFDTGDKSFQCGRLSDVFKLWLVWKQKGMLGLEAKLNHFLDLADYLARKVATREGFQLVIKEHELTNVSFWYLPPCLRHLSPQANPLEESERLTKVAPLIKSRMISKGSMMIAYQPLPGGVPNFFRMVTHAPRSTFEDMDFLLDEIERLGHDIEV